MNGISKIATFDKDFEELKELNEMITLKNHIN
jgi:predicted nucleic acid-binding protein